MHISSFFMSVRL